MPRLLLGFAICCQQRLSSCGIRDSRPPPTHIIAFSLVNRGWCGGLGSESFDRTRVMGTLSPVCDNRGLCPCRLSAAGIIVPYGWWQSLTVVASVASLLLLVCFWHNWLIVGVVIDIALLALMASNWQPFAV